jgi:molybdopterin synthase catalytic subunit
MFRLDAQRLDPDALRRQFDDPRAGAFASFEGRVRGRNDDRLVSVLEYEAYRELAEKEGERILNEARQKFAVLSAGCVHRIGRLQVGQLAVWVGVTAEHRDAAFDACRYIIDELKTRVPIWKKEHYAAGAAEWINVKPHAKGHPPEPAG